MLMNLLIGLSTMVVCLFLQAAVLALAIRQFARFMVRAQELTRWSILAVLSIVMLLLLVGNIAQLMIWAQVFMWLGEFDGLETAVYHSAVNFATLGYGDIVMSAQYRLLGPLEAINGVLMIGVSTATMIAAIQAVLRKKMNALEKEVWTRH